MKRQTMLQAPQSGEADNSCLTDISAEDALEREIAKLGEWLAAQGLDLRDDQAHAYEGSRDRLYWRYGYFMGLKQAQVMLTNRGATVH